MFQIIQIAFVNKKLLDFKMFLLRFMYKNQR